MPSFNPFEMFKGKPEKKPEDSSKPSFEDILDQTSQEDAIQFFTPEGTRDQAYFSEKDIERVETAGPDKLRAFVQRFDEVVPALGLEGWEKARSMYDFACNRVARRYQVNLHDVSRKAMAFEQVRGFKFYPHIVKEYARKAVEAIVGEKLISPREVNFFSQLSDSNSIEGMARGIDRIAAWFIDQCLVLETPKMRQELFDAFGSIDVRSLAFGIAKELQKRLQTKEFEVRPELLKARMKEFIEKVLKKDKQKPEAFEEMRLNKVRGFFAGSHTEREHTGITKYSYSDVIRPEDRKFLEDFVKEE